jgi:hypothetical protein
LGSLERTVARRSALLIQSACCQRFFDLVSAETEDLRPKHLPAAKPKRGEQSILDPSITSGEPAGESAEHDHLVSSVVDPIDLLAPVKQHLPLGAEDGSEFVMATPRPGFDGRRGVHELDVLVGEGEDALQVAPVPSVAESPSEFHVLAGHRRSVWARITRSANIRSMSDYRAHAHLDAPLDEVWALVGNPATYPRWWPIAVEIRGETFEVGDVYTQVLGQFAGRRVEYVRMIDRRDELKELRWSCPTTGGFQHWQLTAAQGGTFVDMEMGLRPAALPYRVFDRTVGRWFIKRWADQAIDGLREALASPPDPPMASP